MRRMGGLARKLPRTAAVFTVGALALAGFPLTAGFFSKDAILEEALHRSLAGSAGWFLLWLIGYGTAVLTAFYATRQLALVFLGEYRGAHGGSGHGAEAAGGELHEAPAVMLVPLYVLAGLSLVGGFLAVPAFLAGEPGPAHEGGAALGWALGSLAAVGGIAAGLYLYRRSPALRGRLVASRPGATFRRLSSHKFYVDELYDLVIVRPLHLASLVLFYVVDRTLIDGILVRGSSLVVVAGAGLLRKVQTGRILSYTALFICGVLGILTLIFWAAG
jgi:NADH-quinone oxidoreductase subunit L